jgi:hypothetical protein
VDRSPAVVIKSERQDLRDDSSPQDSVRRQLSPFHFLPCADEAVCCTALAVEIRCKLRGQAFRSTLPFQRRSNLRSQYRGDSCTYDGSKIASFGHQSLDRDCEPGLPLRTNVRPEADVSLERCTSTWRISRLLFAGTLANARWGHQMPIRHRGHAGLPRAGLDARPARCVLPLSQVRAHGAWGNALTFQPE